ncbi:unnamed protein product [Spirodela intermedia]|uniref:Uncharacterized protein n=1 Tax=Spirodela intermedia TaxID=51605 RepID=A0A7I8IUI6_SPIIN|nr:unnamed protein product [Spirodela intermedia]CAA6661488.1 unnamed protein product [Spirodela intermedia]
MNPHHLEKKKQISVSPVVFSGVGEADQPEDADGEQPSAAAGNLKSKLKAMRPKKPYDKVEKSDSMRMEIRSRRARKLIAETLKIADSPGHRNFAL